MHRNARLILTLFVVLSAGGCALYRSQVPGEETMIERQWSEYQQKVAGFAAHVQCIGGCDWVRLLRPYDARGS